MVSDPVDDRVVKAISVSARQAASKHRGYAEYDDFVNEGYLYLWENPELADDVSKDGLRVLQASVLYAMNRFGMRQRYAQDGTQPGDYFRYTRAIVRELVPEVLHGEVLAVSEADLNHDRRGSKTLAEGGDRMAMVADVSQALDRVNDKDRLVLNMKFMGGEITDEVLGIQMHITTDAARKRVDRALLRVAKLLNGDYSPKRHRRTRSNANAQFITRSQEGV